MLSFLLLLWVNTTAGSVYNITPDDHYYPNTICRRCHNLQHYLFNTTKYFTSNTQLLFLPGLHHLHTDLIIQNVHNVSLIGSTTNGTTIIQCNSSVGIVLTNITNLMVTNIAVQNCFGNEYNNATVLIKQCTNVQLRHVVIEENNNSYGVVGINIMGDSHFSYIASNVFSIHYVETKVDMENHSLIVDHYHPNDNDINVHKTLLNLFQQSYRVNFYLLHSMFQGLKYGTAITIKLLIKSLKQNTILVQYFQFCNSFQKVIDISVLEAYYDRQPVDLVHFDMCNFFNNHLTSPWYITSAIIYIKFDPINVHISNCFTITTFQCFTKDTVSHHVQRYISLLQTLLLHRSKFTIGCLFLPNYHMLTYI